MGMNDDNEVRIPFYIGGDQYGEISLLLMSEAADDLTDGDVITIMRESIEMDKLPRRIRKAAKHRREIES